MISELLIVARAGREPHVEGCGGLTARRTEPDTVHLVSTAATPLGGDTIRYRVVVEVGARLRLRTAAATIAMPGAVTLESRSNWELEVEGDLDVDPEPLIVAGSSRHVSVTRVAMSDRGHLRLRERIQIGRSYDADGFWSGTLHADVGATPLLRHRIEVGVGGIGDDALGTPMACVSELRYPQAEFATNGTLLKLAAGGGLATWQGQRLGA